MAIIIQSLSHSTVQGYIDCPEKVFLDKVDHTPKRGYSSNMALGSGFHSAAEVYYRAVMLKHRIDAEVLFRIFESRWSRFPADEIIYGEKDREEIFVKAKQLIDLLVNAPLPHQVLAVERSLSLSLTSNLKIIGRPDLIIRDSDGWLTICDIKTSAKAYSDEDLFRCANQMLGYGLALDEPVKFKVMLFLKKKVPELINVPIAPDLVGFEEWRNRALMVKLAIEKGIRYRNRSYRCDTCEYGYLCNGACEEEMRLAA
jgi:CRISPR/Cas system-associated exonuclease Cas4 (RecB family)